MTTAADGPPPLSVAQEALWYVGTLDPRRLSYNETVSIRKDGPLDVEALRRTLAELLRRHETWRTTFATRGGQPVQVVGPVPDVDLPVTDLSGLAFAEAEQRAVQVVAERSRVPYDLRRGPLVRPMLVRFPDEHHRLYLAMHHIVFDGVSLFRVVFPELVALYDAFRAGAPSPLPEPAATYADYARWQQEWMEGPRAARRLAHWRGLADAPALAVPLDRPRPSEPRYRGGVLPLEVPAGVVAALRAAGRGAGASLFQALAAAWAVLQSGWSDQDDVVFSTPADLRQRAEYEGVVGYALTPLALRVDLAGDPTFSELVMRVRNELLDGMDNAVPFERVVRELGLGESMAANPVYETMIVLEPPLGAADPAWSLHLMDSAVGDAVGVCRLPLELQLDERPEGHLAGRLIYDRDLFEAATAERVVDHFSRLVAAVAADPSLTVSQAPLADGSREQRRLAAFTATAVSTPQRTVAERIANRVLTHPDAPAITAGGETLTYAELAARGGDVQGIAGLDVLRRSADPGTCCVAATRGGRLVPQSHAAVANLAVGLGDLALGPGDTVLVLPSTLVRAPAVALWLPLMAGARIVIADADLEQDGARLSRLIAREKASFLHAAPSTWQALVDSGLRAGRGLRALAGGERLAPELAAAVLDRCTVLWNAYGAPEVGTYALAGRVEPGEPVTVGRPLANVDVAVVDRHGRPAAIGLFGELRITGVDGVELRTGDRARWRPDGTVELAPPVPGAG